MPSPFPGMDPYLEADWGDIHLRLCAHISETLQPHLPRDLRARTGCEVLLEDAIDGREAKYVPDATIYSASEMQRRRPNAQGVVTIEPVVIRVINDPPVHRWVQIIDIKSGNRVITAIEILSPGNKRPGPLNAAYRRKIDGYIEAGVNVVELDLLRGKRHQLSVQHSSLPPERDAAYLYCVHRSDGDGEWLVYPMPLRDRLPIVPVPLRPTDPDVTLDLQIVIDRVYTAGGHDDIDYTQPADPPLSPEDVAWLAER